MMVRLLTLMKQAEPLHALNLYRFPRLKNVTLTALFSRALKAAGSDSLVIEGDFNAHSTLRGYVRIEKFERKLAELVSTLGVTVHTDPADPLWVREKGGPNLDDGHDPMNPGGVFGLPYQAGFEAEEALTDTDKADAIGASPDPYATSLRIAAHYNDHQLGEGMDEDSTAFADVANTVEKNAYNSAFWKMLLKKNDGRSTR
ncbi:hypothetical protein HPB51_010310 [Rhipicephalus microplus]|uniref:Endonuclease/exonuclease/phosphatase domain-containing protein n=1 Tax=Rhipicephalus microplus TaxID=6941 RepID=A0A9J6D4X6_RHIMP|nr:hypothetical protein HPB51_010310 [Rhipicephalus microplus]